MQGLPMVRPGAWCAVLLLPSAFAVQRAASMQEWIYSMRINVPSRYSEEIGGVRVKVSDMKCEKLVVGSMAARYVAPTSLHFEFDGIEAKCEGDYFWKYDAWPLGNVKGDGKVSAREMADYLHRRGRELGIAQLEELGYSKAKRLLKDERREDADAIASVAHQLGGGGVPTFHPRSEVREEAAAMLMRHPQVRGALRRLQLGAPPGSDGDSGAGEAPPAHSDSDSASRTHCQLVAAGISASTVLTYRVSE